MARPEDVLYVHVPERQAELELELARAGAHLVRAESRGSWYLWPPEDSGGRELRLRLAPGLAAAVDESRRGYFNLMVADGRRENGGCSSLAADLVAALRKQEEPERSFPPHRVIAVLEHCPDLAERTFALGTLRIRSWVTDPFDGGSLRRAIEEILSRRGTTGKVALCLAGGGVEGLLFELGVLRAINAYLENRSLVDADIFCGISAGSILASLLANGVEPDEVVRALEGRGGDVEPLSSHLVYDIDFLGIVGRVLALYGSVVASPSPGRLVSRVLRAVPNGVFKGDRIEAYLEQELTKPGRTNNFRQLRRELYIGATEQDTYSHVIFGLPGLEDVPISRAVRASSGLLPFYGPTTINGRNYVDGQYTRTANFHLAVQRGATLVLIVDPLIPLRAERPGYVAAKGGVFGSLQGIKAMIHTRFTNALAHAVEAYPDVHFHVFKPEREDMRLMSGSPMKYTVRTQIIDLAYRCAVQKIQDRADLLRVHLARHGWVLRRAPKPR